MVDPDPTGDTPSVQARGGSQLLCYNVGKLGAGSFLGACSLHNQPFLNKKVGDLVPHAAAALLVLFADRPFYVGPTCWMNLISSQTQISLQAPGTAKVSETELHGLLDDMLGAQPQMCAI